MTERRRYIAAGLLVALMVAHASKGGWHTPHSRIINAPGLHVMIVTERGTKLPTDQQPILTSGDVRDVLNSACPLIDTDTGWKFFDKDEPTEGLSQVWVDALARPRESLPWLIISSDKGSFEGPLNKDVASFKAHLAGYVK